MHKVTVEISPALQKLARSPFYYLIAALYGVAITFAPIFLFWSGSKADLICYETLMVELGFLVICPVGLFYILLGGAVVKALRRGLIS